MFRRGPVQCAVTGAVTIACCVAGVVQSAAAARGPADVLQTFAVHSGDACRMGAAEGTLVWHLPPGGRTVDGSAKVADRPVPDVPAPGCRDDGRLTVLSVVGHAGGESVGRVLLEADNGSREYPFRLTSSIPIDEVLVQVCRRTPLQGSPAYCGAVQVFRMPVATDG